MDMAYEQFKQNGKDNDYQKFCSINAFWLDDFALFKSIKAEQEGKVWSGWPQGLKDRDKEEIDKARIDSRRGLIGRNLPSISSLDNGEPSNRDARIAI